jgi:hypothetical protein
VFAQREKILNGMKSNLEFIGAEWCMKIKVYGRYLWVVLLFGFTLDFPANAGELTDVVKSAWDRVIQVLKDPTLSAKDKKQERVARLKRLLIPLLNTKKRPNACSDHTGSAGLAPSKRSL